MAADQASAVAGQMAGRGIRAIPAARLHYLQTAALAPIVRITPADDSFLVSGRPRQMGGLPDSANLLRHLNGHAGLPRITATRGLISVVQDDLYAVAVARLQAERGDRPLHLGGE